MKTRWIHRIAPLVLLVLVAAGCDCPDCPECPEVDPAALVEQPATVAAGDCWEDYTCTTEKDQGRNVHRFVLDEQDGKTRVVCANNPDKLATTMLVCRNDLVLLRNELGVEVTFEVPGEDPLFWWNNSDGSSGKVLPPDQWVALRVRPDAVTVDEKAGGHRYQITVKPFSTDPDPVIKVKK